MEFLLVLVAVVVAFYVILLRPVIQQQRQRRRDISSLDVGDEVLTTGGLYAIVREIRTADAGPMALLLDLSPGVTVRATPDAVQQITRRASEAADAEPRQADRA